MMATQAGRFVIGSAAFALALSAAAPGLAGTTARPLGSGHGFFVDSSGHVLTSRHIVQDCPAIRVLSPTLEPQPAKLVALPEHRSIDLALLRTAPVDAGVLAFRDTWPDPSPPAGWVTQIRRPINGSVVAFGDGGRTPLRVPVQIVANRHGDPGIKMLVLRGSVMPGQSGTPIMDEGGQVIGITFARLEADNPLQAMLRNQPGGYAVAAREATDFLARHGIETASPRDPAESRTGAHDAVVRVLCLKQGRPYAAASHHLMD